MSLIHLDDCVAQIVNLAVKGQKNQNLNIFSGPPISQKDFAELIARHLNTEVEQIPMSKLKKLYGKTVFEALTSSIPLATYYPDFSNTDSICYRDPANIIQNAISFFENK
jgi:NAD dependent epimerase/dehydratase family enzyme